MLKSPVFYAFLMFLALLMLFISNMVTVVPYENIKRDKAFLDAIFIGLAIVFGAMALKAKKNKGMPNKAL